jgi:nitrogen fixation protein FixH
MINWGTGIAITYTVFALSMVGAVFASRKHNPGLVQKNYYDLDINYQQRMDQKQNAARLVAAPKVVYDTKTGAVRITLPDDLPLADGTVLLYRSANNQDDITVPFSQKKVVEIHIDKPASGLWHAELTWSAGSTAYFNEATFFCTP